MLFFLLFDTELNTKQLQHQEATVLGEARRGVMWLTLPARPGPPPPTTLITRTNFISFTYISYVSLLYTYQRSRAPQGFWCCFWVLNDCPELLLENDDEDNFSTTQNTFEVLLQSTNISRSDPDWGFELIWHVVSTRLSYFYPEINSFMNTIYRPWYRRADFNIEFVTSDQQWPWHILIKQLRHIACLPVIGELVSWYRVTCRVTAC